MFIGRTSKQTRIFVSVFVLVFFVFSTLVTNVTRVKAQEATGESGVNLGPVITAAPGIATYAVYSPAGPAPVTNITVQPIDYKRNDDNGNAVCRAKVTWSKPANLPDGGNGYILTTGADVQAVKGIDSLTATTGDLTCGATWTFDVQTIRPLNLLEQAGKVVTVPITGAAVFLLPNSTKTGEAQLTAKLPTPGRQNSADYKISISGITTAKTSGGCSATVSWNEPAIAKTDPKNVSYKLFINANDAADASAQYTSGSFSPGTSKDTTSLTCGKEYTAMIASYDSGGNRISNETQGFSIAADGTKGTATAKPSVISAGSPSGANVNASTTNSTSTGGTCDTTCKSKKPMLGWLQVDEQIEYTICQLQCTIIDWVAGMLMEAFNHIVLPNLL